MSNRFAPPLSEVSHQQLSTSPAPTGVALALRFLWISLALGIPTFLYELGRSPDGGAFGISIAFQLALLGFAVYVNVSISRVKNWARIVSLILTVIELGILVAGHTSPDEAVVEVVCNWVAAALDVAAMYMLFSRTSSGWFKSQGAFQP